MIKSAGVGMELDAKNQEVDHVDELTGGKREKHTRDKETLNES